MKENDLRAAMRSLETTLPASALEPRQAASQVVKRHQRQIRVLTGVTIFFWLLAAVDVLWVVYIASWYLYPRHKQLMRDEALGTIAADKLVAVEATHFMVVETATVVLAVSFVSLTLAALSTVLLVLATRRATLAQINLQLAGISAQLRPPPAVPRES